MRLQATAPATVGPYFGIGLSQLTRADLAGPGVAGERVAIEGRVLDGDGRAVDDAVLEFWQANAHGRYAHVEDTRELPLSPGFLGFGRVPTDGDGAFRLTTIKPGSVPGPGGTVQAPHLVVAVFMRGLLKHLLTRMYFPDEPGNADDPILRLVPPEWRHTLIARAAPQGVIGAHTCRLGWDVILQGDDETVFFDY
jgi:protocatechuate 3,4-dioxygenase alpha subunit